MKILITGATGSLGGFLTRYYAEKGHTVIACGRDHTPPKNLLHYASYLNKNITQPFTLPDADLCVHTAALSDDKATPKQLYEPNVMGTKYTSEATSACKKFIHISSSSVYLPDNILLKEEIAGKQNNKLLSPYGASKLQAEEMLKKTSVHSACYILRPRAFYGAGDRVILPRILKLIKNDTFYRPGKMNTLVSLTHYENIAHAIDLCISNDKKGVHTYNVADDKTYTFIDIIRKINKALFDHPVKEKEIPILVLKILGTFKVGGITPLLVRSFTNDMVLDISKIKKELNYQPEADFDSKLEELCEWIKTIGGVDILRTGKKELAWL